MTQVLQPVSIVVPIKNRGNFLPSLIKNLQDLNYPKYEIIIVDDGSTDNTKDLLKKSQIKSILLTKSVGSAEARNLGIRQAKYKVIALTDSDCFVSRNWLRNLVPFLNKYDIVGGKVLFCDKSERKLNPFSQNDEVIIRKDSNINFLNTSNMLLKKDVWNLAGGFLSYRIEDLEFSWRSIKKGFKLIYVPKGLVIHYGKRNPLQNIKKYFHYGKAYSEIVSIHKMEFIFKSEPIFNSKSIRDYIPIIIYSNVVFLVFFISGFFLFNKIFGFSFLNVASFLFVYLFFRFIIKVDVIYKLYKFSITFSIILYTLIYMLKNKKKRRQFNKANQ
ncbi:MAG: glycosyltransferase [Promethearchaeota archaeon]